MVIEHMSATVKERLRQSLKRECVRLCEIEKEMAPLYTPYNCFLDLDTERDTRFARAVRILIGQHRRVQALHGTFGSAARRLIPLQ